MSRTDFNAQMIAAEYFVQAQKSARFGARRCQIGTAHLGYRMSIIEPILR
ncbi:hypothetical protein [Novosphingobium sp. TCA1]|nr:hypothetical protein [Novosphingobium sp. TCA1]